ncbi:hypothetical protein GGR56DRAFT_42875 [Xylariaceae sp. FL0804]|nr:hypothetical protein GGR56DRAFT_42875 [Xylariaceae sp. FL0804]
MEKIEPSSPAPSTHGDTPDDVFQNGFDQLIQHNASASPYPEHAGPTAHSGYNSPTPHPGVMPAYDPHTTSTHGTPVHQNSPYPPPSYPVGAYPSEFELDQSAYPPLNDLAPSTTMTPHGAYNTPATSSPSQHSDVMTTRSGRAVARSGPAPATASASGNSALKARSGGLPKRKKPAKSRRKGEDLDAYMSRSVPLEAPLSVLVRDMTHVTDTDIDAYVRRGPEERRREVASSKDGKVKRPMNAFMLYRKAYQNRTKEWKKHDNHQVISQVCGVSWNMEAQQLRDDFDRWARVERDNHKAAFPDYKFAPTKSKASAGKAKGGANNNNITSGGGNKKAGSRGAHNGDSDDEPEDILEGYNHLDFSAPPSRNASRGDYLDPDAEYLPPGMRASAPYGYPQHSPSPGLQQHGLSPAQQMYHQQQYANQHPHQSQHHHQSSFAFSNPGKPQPVGYGPGAQYYQAASEMQTRHHHPHHASPYNTIPHSHYVQLQLQQQQQQLQQQQQAHAAAAAAAYGHHPRAQQHHPAYAMENLYMQHRADSPGGGGGGSGSLDPYGGGFLGQPGPGAYAMSPPPPPPHHPSSHHHQQQQHHHPIDPSLMAAVPAQQGGGGGSGGGGNGGGAAAAAAANDPAPLDDLDGMLFDGSSNYGLEDGLPGLHQQPYDAPSVKIEAERGGAGGGDGDDGGISNEHAPSWSDDPAASAMGEARLSDDWEATFAPSTEFSLDDIDQILGTTGSPGLS